MQRLVGAGEKLEKKLETMDFQGIYMVSKISQYEYWQDPVNSGRPLTLLNWKHRANLGRQAGPKREETCSCHRYIVVDWSKQQKIATSACSTVSFISFQSWLHIWNIYFTSQLLRVYFPPLYYRGQRDIDLDIDLDDIGYYRSRSRWQYYSTRYRYFLFLMKIWKC